MKEITTRKQASEYLDISEDNILNFNIFPNDTWGYVDKDGNCHLYRLINNNYVELTKNIETLNIDLFNDGRYRLQNRKEYWYQFDKNNKLIRDMKNTVEIKTKKQATEYLKVSKKEISDFHKYDNENWSYRDKNGYYHLFGKINGNWVEFTKNIEAIYVFQHNNDNWSYTDLKGYEHLFRKSNNQWIELTIGVIATYVLPYDNGDWKYRDEKDNEYLFREIKGEYIELTKDIKTICAISYSDKSWSYLNEKGKEIFITENVYNENDKSITNEKEAAEFLGINRKNIFDFDKYCNEDWSYEDKDGYCHLFRFKNNKYVELTKDIDTMFVCSYENGYWEYKDKNNYYHLFQEIDGEQIELTKGIIAINVWSYNNGDWIYKDENEYNHLFRFINGDWIELTKGINTKYANFHNYGDWAYCDEKVYWHLMRKIDDEWIDLTKGFNAIDTFSYPNGNWEYKDEEGNRHLFNKNNELISKT